jgi:hypothetical protein
MARVCWLEASRASEIQRVAGSHRAEHFFDGLGCRRELRADLWPAIRGFVEAMTYA